ncbi:MAG: hypothetical protein Q9204_007546, partial [Flavoplaca sp. TL-2023a]
KGESNAIFTSYNRNFKGRNDGNAATMNFLASPELVTAMSYAGTTTFNPLTDSILTPSGEPFKFSPPVGTSLPSSGFAAGNPTFAPTPGTPSPSTPVLISPTSSRLAALEPFPPFPQGDLTDLRVLLKISGQCTTDTISAAGPWLKYKGHLPNISANTLIGAINAETGETNVAYDHFDDPTAQYTIPDLATKWKDQGKSWLVVAETNYGEGSAREHAALQPRYLGCRVILAKSFARIHEANLKKQGVIPLTFSDPADYDLLGAGDVVTTDGLHDFLKNGGKGEVVLKVQKMNGQERQIGVKCAVSEDQAGFILAGSALNLLAKKKSEGMLTVLYSAWLRVKLSGEMGSSESTRQALRLDLVDQRYVQPYETNQYIADAFDSLTRWRMESASVLAEIAEGGWVKEIVNKSTNSCVSKQLLNEIKIFRGFAKWQTRTDDYAFSVTLDHPLSFTQPTSPQRRSWVPTFSNPNTMRLHNPPRPSIVRSLSWLPFCLLLWPAITAAEKSAADYFITSLPGQPDGPLLTMHAGHVEVTPEHHGNLFFWHFQNRHIANRQRTVLWLNGGPGCSSMDGALMEIGPYRLKDKEHLVYNDGAWDEFANVLFVDNPVGTGFSYVDTDSFVSKITEMADQMVQFLEKFFKLFPEYSNNDLYIAGESYAGQHIPYIAKAILERNAKQKEKWNLSGLLIGNGWISPVEQYDAYMKFGYQAGLIQGGTDVAKKLEGMYSECFKTLNQPGGTDKIDQPLCERILTQMLELTQKDGRCANMYDVRLDDTFPSCGMNWPPDLENVTPYLRRKDVIQALHINEEKKTGWQECAGAVSASFHPSSKPAVAILPKILEQVPTILFSGDKDLICNHVGTEGLIHNMEWNGARGFELSPGTTAPRRDWTFEGEPAGFYQEARNLTYILFYNSSHM